MRRRLAFALTFGTVGAIAVNATAQVTYNTIALVGQHAPGTSAGVTYASFDFPFINDSHQVTFRAQLTGSNVTNENNTALFAGAIAGPQLAAREGDAAPGTADANYGSLGTPAIGDDGQVVFHTYLTVNGVVSTSQSGIFAGPIAGAQLVARAGDPAPGASGLTLTGFTTPFINDVGDVQYTATFNGPGVVSANDRALYGGPASGPVLVARKGAAAPGTPAGVNYADMGIPGINDAGQIAYVATLDGVNVTSENNRAIYVGAFANPQLALRSGGPAPGMPAGTTTSFLSFPVLNDAGQIAFNAKLAASSIGIRNDDVIYAGNPSAPQLIARESTHAPGTPAGTTYAFLDFPSFNNAGHIAYLAHLSSSGGTIPDSRAIFSGPLSNPQPVVQTGAAAPGTAAGVRYGNIVTPFFNDADQLVFGAGLIGPGVTAANDIGIFAYDPVLGHLLIVREGSLFDVDPTAGVDLRTIADNGIGMWSGTNDNSFHAFSNDGVLAFQLTFTDGTTGLFSATVPEPAALAPLAAAIAVGCTRRRPSV